MLFRDREDAGRQLAEALAAYRDCPGGLVLALPRGGVAVGYPVSLALHLPLDVFITRKIAAPENPEYALGAVSEDGNIFLQPDAVEAFGLSYPEVDALVEEQRQEIRRRQELYRKGRRLVSLDNRTVILVDDGIATGATFFASVDAIRRHLPRRLIAAVPVGPKESIAKARALVDDLLVLSMPDPFRAVGGHYADFAQVGDRAVLGYLHLAEDALLERNVQAPFLPRSH